MSIDSMRHRCSVIGFATLVAFMVKSGGSLAGCSNVGMLLTVRISPYLKTDLATQHLVITKFHICGRTTYT